MALGTFTLTIGGDRLDGAPETAARLHLTLQGTGFLIDADADEFKFPGMAASGVGISLPYEIALPTDVTSGESSQIGYRVKVTTQFGGLVDTPIAAQAAGSTHALTDLSERVSVPVSSTQFYMDAAEAAAALAEGFASDAEDFAASVQRGIPGGVAGLDADGDVIDADGVKVTGGGAVDSVNGQTGVVSLSKADVGLSDVDNTSDAAKPVSTAQATALAGKAALSHAHSGADITSGTVTAARLGSGTANSGTFLAGNNTFVAEPSQSEAETGTATQPRPWSALRVKQAAVSAVDAYAGRPKGSRTTLLYNGSTGFVDPMTGAVAASRPSARTDIYFDLIGGGSGVADPAWMINGDAREVTA